MSWYVCLLSCLLAFLFAGWSEHAKEATTPFCLLCHPRRVPQAGRTQPDVAVGRRISDAVTSVPAVDPTVFQKMFGDSVADLLMVVYLSQLARTQLAIAEKLTTKTQR